MNPLRDIFDDFQVIFAYIISNWKRVIVPVIGLSIAVAVFTQPIIFTESYRVKLISELIQESRMMGYADYELYSDVDKPPYFGTIDLVGDAAREAAHEAGLNIERVAVGQKTWVYSNISSRDRTQVTLVDEISFTGFKEILSAGRLPISENETICVYDPLLISVDKYPRINDNLTVFVGDIDTWEFPENGTERVDFNGENITLNVVGLIEYERSIYGFTTSSDRTRAILMQMFSYISRQFYFIISEHSTNLISTILESIDDWHPNVDVITLVYFELGSIDSSVVQKVNTFGAHFEQMIRELTGDSWVYGRSFLLNTFLVVDVFSVIIFIMFLIFSIPSVAIALFLTIFSFGLVRRFRRRQVGVMRIRGASTWQIFLTLISEAFIQILLVVPIGFLIGIPISEVLLLSNDFLSFQGNPTQVLISQNYIIFCFITGFFFVFILNMFSWKEVLKLRPKEGEEPLERRDPIWKRLYLDVFILIPGVFGVIAFYVINLVLRPIVTSFIMREGVISDSGSMLATTIMNLLTFLTFLLALPSILAVILGLSMFISRIFPKFLETFSSLTWKLQGGIISLAMGNTARRKQAAVRATIVISLCLQLCVLSLSVPFTIRNHIEMIVWFANGSEVTVDAYESTNETIARIIRNVTGVAQICEFRSFYAHHSMNYPSYAFRSYHVLGVNTSTFVETAFFLPWFASERIDVLISKLQENGTALIHSENARALLVDSGGKITVPLQGFNTTSFTVTGLFDYWPRHATSPIFSPENYIYLVVSLETFEQLKDDENYNRMRLMESESINQIFFGPYGMNKGYFVKIQPFENGQVVAERISKATGLTVTPTQLMIDYFRGMPPLVVLMSALNFAIGSLSN